MPRTKKESKKIVDRAKNIVRKHKKKEMKKQNKKCAMWTWRGCLKYY